MDVIYQFFIAVRRRIFNVCGRFVRLVRCNVSTDCV